MMFREAAYRAKSKIIAVISIASLIFGFVGSIDDLNPKLSLMIILGVVLISILIIYFREFITVRRGHIRESISCHREVVMMQGSYDENMKYLINDLSPQELEATVFVMGMDKSMQLNQCTKRGIVYHVQQLLEHSFDIPQSDLQQFIDEQRKAMGIEEDSQLSFGNSIFIKIPLCQYGQIYQDKVIKLMLIINSEKSEDGDDEAITGADSQMIVHKIFDEIEHRGEYHRLVMGVMGTNGPNHPYRIILNAILSRFALCDYYDNLNHRIYLKEVIVSVRKEDCERHGLDLSHLEAYLRAFSTFISSRI